MEIVPYSAAHLPDLTRLINTHVASIPPFWTLSEAQVAYVIDHVGTLWDVHYGPDDTPTQYETWCVVEDERILAAVEIVRVQKYLDPPMTYLSWIVAEPTSLDALDALLEHVYLRAAASGASEIYVGLRCPFGVGWFGVPTIWTHIGDAFMRNAFHPRYKWVLMSGEIDSGITFPQPEIPNFALFWQIDEAALDWTLQGYEFGECQAWGIPPHFAGCPGFDEWITIEYLEVSDTFRGRGLGRYLLAEQMRFQAGRGIQHVIAWTEVENIAPQRVNLACGMEYGPTCWTWEARL